MAAWPTKYEMRRGASDGLPTVWTRGPWNKLRTRIIRRAVYLILCVPAPSSIVSCVSESLREVEAARGEGRPQGSQQAVLPSRMQDTRG